MGDPLPPPPPSDGSSDQASRTPSLQSPSGRRRNRVYPVPVYQTPASATTANTEQQATPAVHQQATPAVHQQAAPAVHQQAAPAVHQQATPAVHQQATPAVHQQATPAIQEPKISRFYQFGTFCAQSTNFLFTLPGRLKAHYDELRVAGEQNPTLDPHLQYPCSWPTDLNVMGNTMSPSASISPAPPVQTSENSQSSNLAVGMPYASIDHNGAEPAGSSKRGMANEIQPHQTSGRNTVLGLVKKQRSSQQMGPVVPANTRGTTILNQVSGFSKKTTSQERPSSATSQLKALGSGNAASRNVSQDASGPKNKEKDILKAPTPVSPTTSKAQSSVITTRNKTMTPISDIKKPDTVDEKAPGSRVDQGKSSSGVSGVFGVKHQVRRQDVQQLSPPASKSKPSTSQKFLNPSKSVPSVSRIISESTDLGHIGIKNSQTHDANASVTTNSSPKASLPRNSGPGTKDDKLTQYKTGPDRQQKSGDSYKEKNAQIERPATVAQGSELTDNMKAGHSRGMKQNRSDRVTSASSISTQASDILRRHPQNMATLQKLVAETEAKSTGLMSQTLAEPTTDTAAKSEGGLQDPIQFDYPPPRVIAQPHSRIAIARSNVIGSGKPVTFTAPALTAASTIPGPKAAQNQDSTSQPEINAEATTTTTLATPNPFAPHTATEGQKQESTAMRTGTGPDCHQNLNAPVVSSLTEKERVMLDPPQRTNENKTNHPAPAGQAVTKGLPPFVPPTMEKNKPQTPKFDPFKDFEQLANMTDKWDKLVEARAREGQEPLLPEDLKWVKLFQKMQEKPVDYTNVDTASDEEALTTLSDESQEEVDLEVEGTNKSRKKKKKKKSKIKKGCTEITSDANTSPIAAGEMKASVEIKVNKSNIGIVQQDKLESMPTPKSADTSTLENDRKTLPAPGGFRFPTPATLPINIPSSVANLPKEKRIVSVKKTESLHSPSNLARVNSEPNGLKPPLEPAKTRIQTSGDEIEIEERLTKENLQGRNPLPPKSVQPKAEYVPVNSSPMTSGAATVTGQYRATNVANENPSVNSASSSEAGSSVEDGDAQFPSAQMFSRLTREISKEQVQSIYVTQLRHLATWWNFKDDIDFRAFKAHVKKHITQYVLGRMQGILNEYTDESFFSDDVKELLNEVVEQATEMRLAESDELVDHYLNIIVKPLEKDDLPACSSTNTPLNSSLDSPPLKENAIPTPWTKQLSVTTISGRKSAFQENLDQEKSVPSEGVVEAPQSYKPTQSYHDGKPHHTAVSKEKKEDWLKLLDDDELIRLKTVLKYQPSTMVQFITRPPENPEKATLKGPFFLEKGKSDWHYELMYSPEYFRLLNSLRLQQTDSNDQNVRVKLGKRQRGIKDSGCGILGCTGCRACPGPSGRRLHPRGQCIVVMTVGETFLVEAWVDKEKEVDLITLTPIDNATLIALRKAGVHIKPWEYEEDGLATAPSSRLKNTPPNPATYGPVTANTEDFDEEDYDDGECDPDDVDIDAEIEDEDICKCPSLPGRHGPPSRPPAGNYHKFSDSIANSARMQAEVGAFLIEERINELKKQKQVAIDENTWLIQERINLLEKQQLLEKEIQRREAAGAGGKNLQQQQQQEQQAQGKQRK